MNIPKFNLLDVPILERKDINGRRYYVSRGDDGNIISGAVSTTSLTKEAMPRNPFLEEWMIGFGGRIELDRAVDTTAYYGTIMHIVMGDLVNGLPVMLGEREIDKYFKLNELDKSDGGLPEYSGVRLPATVNKKSYGYARFRRDTIAIWQFVQDYLVGDNVEVVGIEMPLSDFKLGIAGCLDLVVKYTEKVMDGDKHIADDIHYAIFDLKTGDGHYDEHDVQLNAYQRLLSNYLEVPLENITMFDVHMKDWRPDTYKNYLDPNKKTKTTPYNLVQVEQSDMFEYYLDGYYRRNVKQDFNKKEINFDTNIEEVVKQYRGKE